MLDTLVKKIKSIGSFSDDEVDFFAGQLEVFTVAKGEHFLQEGQICRHLGYVESGLMMYYRLYDGIEIPTDFGAENDWVSHLNSFTNKTASDVAIKALEDTRLLRLSAESFEKLHQHQPRFLLLKDYYTEFSLNRQARHTADLAMLSAKQRYYKFMEEKADIVNRVPQYYIAAYLGIKPQSLSRIRK